MGKDFLDRFLLWCENNLLNIEWKLDNIFQIKGLEGDFLLLPPSSTGNIFDVDLGLNSDDEDLLYLFIDSKVKYLVFEFGTRFYFSDRSEKDVIFKNSFNEVRCKACFNDLKFLGDCKLDVDIPFIHLGVHSEYELLNGAHNPSLWVKKAKFLKQNALAIVDKNTLAGTLSFQIECVKKGIKPIFGMTASVAINYNPKDKIPVTYSMKVYVMDETGWQNILKINRFINVDYNGFIPEEIFLECSEGLIVVFDTNSQLFALKSINDAKLLIKKYSNKFTHLFCQIDTVEFYDDNYDLQQLEKIKHYALNLYPHIKPVLINDSYYLDQEMYRLKDMLNKVDKTAYPYSEDQHYKTLDESQDKLMPLFKDKERFFDLFSEMVYNTNVISDLCNHKLNTGEHKLPRYEFVKDMSNDDFFINLILEGFERKVGWKDNSNVYNDRMIKELGVIMNAGFVDYFLILWDIVKWAKGNGIFVGVARGSIGGCLLAYLLDIIEIDPIEHDLLFERFLNEARVSGERAKAADAMPDVDLDFESNERDNVKKYIYEKFGTLHSCSIGAYTRLKLKAGIKDFGRVRGVGYADCNAVSKDIDNQLTYTWEDLIKYAMQHNKIRNFVQRYPEIAHCIKFSLGQARSASMHASAVVIVPKQDQNGNDVNIFNWMPVRKIDGVLVAEWEGKYCERAGFLKEDILSLLQLDKFKRMLQLIEKNYDLKIDLNDIDLNDKATFDLFKKGFTDEAFQFNSKGFRTYSQRVKPTCFNDLVAMNALYRPGPMSSNAHTDYAKIKHKQLKASYDYMLREVTESTNGLYIYQEQVMKAVQVLGKFSLVEADILRTQIKKFDKVAMKASEEKFLKGAMENDCPPEQALKIWNKLLAFSGYGFNKSHAAAYTLMTYWSMWLKANFPLEFWTASLNFTKKEELIPSRIAEMMKLRQGVKVVPPSINNSRIEFECDKETQQIYWSLLKIKGLGDAGVGKILQEREKNGKFKNYADFVNRMPKKDLNKKSVLALILSGAFDELEGITQPEARLGLLKRHFNRIGEPLPENFLSADKSLLMKSYFWIFLQRQYTGFGDVNYKGLMLSDENKRVNQLAAYYIEPMDFAEGHKTHKKVVVCGLVVYNKIKVSKNGKEYGSINMLCNNEEISMLIWSDVLEDWREFITECNGKIIVAYGKANFDTFRLSNVLYSFDDTEFYYL